MLLICWFLLGLVLVCGCFFFGCVCLVGLLVLVCCCGFRIRSLVGWCCGCDCIVVVGL